MISDRHPIFAYDLTHRTLASLDRTLRAKRKTLAILAAALQSAIDAAADAWAIYEGHNRANAESWEEVERRSNELETVTARWALAVDSGDQVSVAREEGYARRLRRRIAACKRRMTEQRTYASATFMLWVILYSVCEQAQLNFDQCNGEIRELEGQAADARRSLRSMRCCAGDDIYPWLREPEFASSEDIDENREVIVMAHADHRNRSRKCRSKSARQRENGPTYAQIHEANKFRRNRRSQRSFEYHEQVAVTVLPDERQIA